MTPAAPPSSPPRAYRSRLLNVRDECAGVKTFRLEVPRSFSFIPGMWVMLRFPDGPNHARAYSIASSPCEKGCVEISLNKVGPLTARLFELKRGETLDLKGPYGKWLFNDEAEHAVLISGGTALAPFRSMCRYALDKRLPNRLTLLYSAKTPSDILYRRELEGFAKAGIKVYVTITRPQAMDSGEAWGGPTGRLGPEVIEREVPGFLEAWYFVCGPTTLVKDITEALRQKGIPRARIRSEKWGDYSL